MERENRDRQSIQIKLALFLECFGVRSFYRNTILHRIWAILNSRFCGENKQLLGCGMPHKNIRDYSSAMASNTPR
jgi:hypothetical protein